MKLRIASDVTLPDEAITETFAILGIRGSGKTNTAVVMAEEMLKANQQVVCLDPTDAWYGLRSSRDGKSEGFKIIIAGGDHADIPLEGVNGHTMAEFVVETGASIVFSLRHLSMNDQRRFAQDFAERLYDLKGKNRAPLHIFVDEADEFVPQRIPHGFERMFGAYDRIVRRGRIAGIGVTMISQRPQVINKDTLSQIGILICMRLMHKLDRKSVKESWVEGHDVMGKTEEFMDSLASLNRGEAWIWGTTYLDIFRRVNIRHRETFDSSVTPKAGDRPKEITARAEVDLDALKKRLASTIEKAKADDPRELRRRIVELEKQLKASPSSHSPDLERQLKMAEGEVFQLKRDIENWKLWGVRFRDRARKVAQACIELGETEVPTVKETEPILPRHGAVNIQEVKKRYETTPPQRVERKTDSDTKLPTGELAILKAVAQYPDGAGRDQISILTGYKRSSRDTYIQRLSTKGYVNGGSGGPVFSTKEGITALGNDYEPLPTGEELADYWINRLPTGERRILGILLQHHGHPISRETLTDQTGYKRSSRDTYIQRLMSRRLVESAGAGEIKATTTLFQD